MAMKRARSYSRVTKQALSVLGKLIKAGRLERKLTAIELSERAGITRKTLRNIENGEAGSEIGTVFEVAALVGVRLFDVDDRTLAIHNARLDEKLTLLPKSVRHSRQEVDDDF
jgi:transcriptional regulator with XRE-family HTH domain